MNINNSFPSNYLKAADLQGKRITLTIREVTVENVGKDDKPIVYFEGKEKGLCLNKTNSITITEIAGTPETDNWTGTKIVLFSAKVDFQGQRVDAIRIDWPAEAKQKQQANSDDIPF